MAPYRFFCRYLETCNAGDARIRTGLRALGGKMMRISSLFTAAVALPLACAPPSTTAGSHSSNIISREEIAGAHVTNAYDAVTALRPTFLRFHGHTSIQKDTLCSTASSGYVSCKAPTEASGGDTGYPRIYLNHQFYGDITSLRGINATDIQEIHYYNLQEASTRFGLGNVSGVIEVLTASPQ